VRVGLVVVGAAIALVGAGVIVAIIDPGDNPPLDRMSAADVQDLSTGNWRTFVMHTTPANRATLSLSWSATAPASVRLYALYSCSEPPGYCPESPAIETWPGGLNGSWSASGAVGSEYELWVEPTSLTNVTLNFTAAFSETYHNGPLSLPLYAFLVTLSGGAVLAGIGGVVLYLGLFLPAGVYRPLDEPAGGLPAGPDPTPVSAEGGSGNPGAPGGPK